VSVSVQRPFEDVMPVVLLAGSGEWYVRSLESILTGGGYRSHRVHTGASAYAEARKRLPDAIILSDLANTDALDLCRRLRGDGRIVPSTPILLALSAYAGRARTIEALRAGASEIVAPPIDAEEFLLRLASHLRSKGDADALRARAHIDPGTGFYTAYGLDRRFAEMGARAARAHEPVACVVLTWEESAGEGTQGLALAQALVATARRSDAVARPGAAEVVVLAPGTGEDGAAALAARLVNAAEGATGSAPRAGVNVVTQWPRPGDPVDTGFLTQACAAARQRAAQWRRS
jgi:PleD family two-component response regulator